MKFILASRISGGDRGGQSQQVQKYERGRNRIGAGRRVRIAGALDVSVLALFEGIKGAHTGRMAPRRMPRWRTPSISPSSRRFHMLRQAVLGLVRQIAGHSRRRRLCLSENIQIVRGHNVPFVIAPYLLNQNIVS